MIKIIGPTAKINPKFIKSGTVEGRYEVVQNLEEKFYNRIKRYKNSGKDSFEYIKKAYNYVLEGRIALRLDKIPSNSDESSAVWFAHDASKRLPEDVIGYLVKYRSDYPNVGFAGIRTDILMHEADHLFTNITNPKYVVRLNKVAKSDDGNLKFMEFFINHFQSLMTPKECAEKTKEFLKIVPEDKQIDVLQNFRYNLIKEITAYNAGNKYYERELLLKTKPEEECFKQIEFMGLREKLTDLTELLRATLVEKRAELKHKKQ